ncbi:ABC transporter ATP-binding protein [Lactiplantibacillus plantarum]|nr:ABC transporter ATP-binding protein [Lactiplantibacillus plantarum]
MVNTILKEADLFCPNSVRINFTIYYLYNNIIIFCNRLQKSA